MKFENPSRHEGWAKSSNLRENFKSGPKRSNSFKGPSSSLKLELLKVSLNLANKAQKPSKHHNMVQKGPKTREKPSFDQRTRTPLREQVRGEDDHSPRILNSFNGPSTPKSGLRAWTPYLWSKFGSNSQSISKFDQRPWQNWYKSMIRCTH